MLADIKWIREKYEYFNNLLWGGRLPNITFKIINTERVWGYARYQYDVWDNTVTPLYIAISNKYDSPEYVKINVLLHEMIHIADYTFNPSHFVRNGKKISKRQYDAHGPIFFLPEMNRINKVVIPMGYVVNPNVTKEEQEASELSPINKERMKKKLDAGTTIFLFKIKDDTTIYDGKAYAYCQESMRKRWEDYIGFDSWWKKTREWTDEYIAHNERFAKLRSLQPGSGRYISSNIEDFIKKYDLKFVKHLQGKNPNEPQIAPQTEKPINPSEKNYKPAESPKNSEERIKIFRFPTIQGNIIEFRNLTKEELRAKLRERLPKWNEEAIERAINNPKYYPLKEEKNMEKKTLNEEELRKYVAKLVKEEIEQMNIDNSSTPGMRRSKVKQINSHTFEESIE